MEFVFPWEEGINSLFCFLASVAFTVLIKLPLSQLVNFLTSTILNLSSIPLEGNERAAALCLVAVWC